jgi:hypothetical protein
MPHSRRPDPRRPDPRHPGWPYRPRTGVALTLALVACLALAPEPARTQETEQEQQANPQPSNGATAADRIAAKLAAADEIEYLWYIARDTGNDNADTGLDILESVSPAEANGGDATAEAVRPGTYRTQVVVRYRTDDTWDWYAVRFGVAWDQADETDTMEITAVHNLHTETGARPRTEVPSAPSKSGPLHTVQGAGVDDPNVLTPEVCQLLKPWMGGDPAQAADPGSCPEAPSNAYARLVVQQLLSLPPDPANVGAPAASSITLGPLNTVLTGTPPNDRTGADAANAVRTLHRFLCPGGAPADPETGDRAIACPPAPDQWTPSTAVTNTATSLTALVASGLQDFRTARFHPQSLDDPLDAAHPFENGLFRAFRNAAEPRLVELSKALAEIEDQTGPADSFVGTEQPDPDAEPAPESPGVEPEENPGELPKDPATPGSNGEDGEERDWVSERVIWGAVAILVLALVVAAVWKAVRPRLWKPDDQSATEQQSDVKTGSTKSGETGGDGWHDTLPSDRAAEQARQLDPGIQQEVRDQIDGFKQAIVEEVSALAAPLLTPEELDHVRQQARSERTHAAHTAGEETANLPPYVRSLFQTLFQKSKAQAQRIEQQNDQILRLESLVDDLSARLREIERQAPAPDALIQPEQSSPRPEAARDDTPSAGPTDPATTGPAASPAPTQAPQTEPAPQAAQPPATSARSSAGSALSQARTGNGIPPAFHGMHKAFAPGGGLRLPEQACRRIQDTLREAIRANPDDEAAVWRQFGQQLVEHRLEEGRSERFYDEVSEALQANSGGRLRLIVPRKAAPFDDQRMSPVETAVSYAGDRRQIQDVTRPGIELSGEVLLPALVRLGS